MDPSPGAVAVAEARNILGGVNPPVQLPTAPQPFWLKGPLEPPLGGHFHHTDSALQRAWKQPVIHHSEYNLWRAIAFWNVHCGTLAGRGPPGHRPGRDRARRGVKRERSSSRTYTLSRRPCALNYTIEVVIITDEPASWGHLGGLLEPQVGSKMAQDGPKMRVRQ